MAQIGQIFNIVAGPCKRDLIIAFGNTNAGQTVEFQYFISDSRFKLRTGAAILSLAHEGYSGEGWNFTATVRMPDDLPGRISGYYNTHLRIGNFTIVA